MQKIKDTLIELIQTLRQALQEKWNTYENKWLLAPLAAIFLYLSGIIAQIGRNRNQWVPGEQALFPSFNPLKAFIALFSSYGIKILLRFIKLL